MDKEILERKMQFAEMKVFQIVNGTAKAVPTSQVSDFKTEVQKYHGKDFDYIEGLPDKLSLDLQGESRAIKIIRCLNDMNKGVWHRKIRETNQRGTGKIVSQKSFTDSLKPIVSHADFEGYSDDALSILIDRYWEAIATLCPEAISEPRKHLLQRVAGVFILNKLFRQIINESHTPNKSVTVNAIIKTLTRAETKKYFRSEYWINNGPVGERGSSQKSFGFTYNEIKDAIDRSSPKDTGNKLPYKL